MPDTDTNRGERAPACCQPDQTAEQPCCPTATKLQQEAAPAPGICEETPEPAPCCGPRAAPSPTLWLQKPHWVTGSLKTPIGEVPRVSGELVWRDRLGSWAVRWGIGRMRYRVRPGLYAVGSPDAESPVLVTANFKMSFDALRRELGGLDAWIVVLDTKGINVWCAAGGGLYGTDEVVRRIEALRLREIVSRGTLVLPQLCATGVAAHEVKVRSGFRVVYGPVRARDIPAFLAAGMKATPQMRRVAFGLRDRAVLIPVDLVGALKSLALAAIVVFGLGGLGAGFWSGARAASVGWHTMALLLAGVAAGSVLTPIALPWLPGRAFSTKGAIAGALFLALAWLWTWHDPGVFTNPATFWAWLLLIPAVASFIAMNFTGASTFTSLSGVRKEMRAAVPIQIAAGVIGFGLWIAGRFV